MKNIDSELKTNLIKKVNSFCKKNNLTIANIAWGIRYSNGEKLDDYFTHRKGKLTIETAVKILQFMQGYETKNKKPIN